MSGFALTYIEVFFLTREAGLMDSSPHVREAFMSVVERRRVTCPQLAQIVRRYCVRIAVFRGIIAEARTGLALSPRGTLAWVKALGQLLAQEAGAPPKLAHARLGPELCEAVTDVLHVAWHACMRGVALATVRMPFNSHPFCGLYSTCTSCDAASARARRLLELADVEETRSR